MIIPCPRCRQPISDRVLECPYCAAPEQLAVSGKGWGLIKRLVFIVLMAVAIAATIYGLTP